MRARQRFVVTVATAVLLASILGGCARDDGPTLRVGAASSLTEAFTAMADDFEGDHDGLHVEVTFAASSALARQVHEGSPLDVVALAGEEDLDPLVAAGDARPGAVFARNKLAILVERGNPKGIHSLADLARPDVVLVTCAPEVPCGRLANAVLADAGVTAAPASHEENVKAVVAKVTLGEADAGIVYRTDVTAARGKADGVPIDHGPERDAVYVIAVTSRASDATTAAQWVTFVRSPAGRRILTEHGFASA